MTNEQELRLIALIAKLESRVTDLEQKAKKLERFIQDLKYAMQPVNAVGKSI